MLAPLFPPKQKLRIETEEDVLAWIASNGRKWSGRLETLLMDTSQTASRQPRVAGSLQHWCTALGVPMKSHRYDRNEVVAKILAAARQLHQRSRASSKASHIAQRPTQASEETIDAQPFSEAFRELPTRRGWTDRYQHDATQGASMEK